MTGKLIHPRMPMIRRDRASNRRSDRPAIGKLFHVTHLVDDLEASDRLYDDVFACERIYHDYEHPVRRTASLNIVADQCIEPMWLSDDPADVGRSLQRFKSRFGTRLHSIAWYVEDITIFIRHLLDFGIRLTSLTGRPIGDAAGVEAVFTDAADTGALLEFCEARYVDDPRLAPDYDGSRWIEHPLGLTHTSHITVLVDDLDLARRIYGDALMGEHLATDESDPTRPRAYYAVGTDTVIDAVAPSTSSTPEGADYASAGSAVHAVTFATVDLDRAVDFLASRGIETFAEGEHQVWLDLDPGYGIRLGLTEKPVVPAR
jgi:catechol 2,3-dioxygenase-like lactoylglutathione lyase family enzyme